jgi:hypothetical protein
MNTSNIKQLDQVNKLKTRIVSYLSSKYPASYVATSGFTDTELGTVITRVLETSGTDGQKRKMNINNLISILERKLRERMYSENRLGRVVNTNQYTMDPLAEISRDTYVNQNFNPVRKAEQHAGPEVKPIDESSDKAAASATSTSDSRVTSGAEDINAYKKAFEDENVKDMTLFVPEERSFNYNIVIDSRDRDFTKYPNANYFVIDFSPPSYNGTSAAGNINTGYISRAFGNIISCDLLEFSLLDTTDRVDSSDSKVKKAKIPYIILELAELGGNYQGTNDNLNRAFAMLTTFESIEGYKHYNVNSDNSYHTITKVFNPRINLNKLTIQLKLPDGTPYRFGAVDESGDERPSLVKLSFRITCLQKNLATTFYSKAVY